MKKPNYPYYGNPSPYYQHNSSTRFVTGLVAGAAVAYLLSNKKVTSTIAATGSRAWSALRGEVEELKERLADTEAELQHYRNLHKDEE